MEKWFVYTEEDIRLLQIADKVLEAFLDSSPTITDNLYRFSDITNTMLEKNNWKIGGLFVFEDEDENINVKISFYVTFNDVDEKYICAFELHVYNDKEYFELNTPLSDFYSWKRIDHLVEEILEDIDTALSNKCIDPENVKVLNIIKSNLKAI